MNLIQRPNKSGDKISFYFDLGREKGQRDATGVFIYAKPKDPIQKNHNKEAIIVYADDDHDDLDFVERAFADYA